MGALVLLVLGLAARAALGGLGVGDRSALVMIALLSAATWVTTRQLAGPRAALIALLIALGLFDFAALPQRDPPPYDDLQAFYTTDQVLSAQLTGSATSNTGIRLLVQPVFAGQQPQFGLAGTVGDTAAQWNCTFARGIQWLALPINAKGTDANVQLHLTGSPSHDGDYLIVYASSHVGGFLISLGPPEPGDTTCSAA